MDKRPYLTHTNIVIAILAGIVLIGLGVLIGHSSPQVPGAISSPTEPTNTVTIQGHGLLRVKPEIAQLSMGVEKCSQEASEANQTVNDGLAAVTKRLKEAGVDEKDIMPTSFSLYPNYQQSLSGFCASNQLLVTTANLGEVSRLIDMAIEAGVTNVYGVSFTMKDTEAAKQAVIDLALADADKQAQRLSTLLNRPVRHVVKVNMETIDNLSSYILGYRGGGGGGAIAPQEGTVEIVVTVVYELG